MVKSLENKRAGRESELRKKLKASLSRYEDVFKKPLSVNALEEFLDESEKNNRLVFLKDRIGVLSDQDVKYLRDFLKEQGKGEVEVEVGDSDSLEELSEIDDDDIVDAAKESGDYTL